MTTPTVAYEPGAVLLLDQTKLPQEETVLRCDTIDKLIDGIYRLVVRGAPAIGVAAGYGVALAADLRLRDGEEDLAPGIRADCERLRAARPTAVNLAWALDRMLGVLQAAEAEGLRGETLRDRLAGEALAIDDEDKDLCRRMGANGAALLPDRATVITHCNTGALATAGIGTALGVVFAAVEAGKAVEVFADETRPLLQGARLTAWELHRAGIPVRVICDGAAAWTMKNHRIDAVFVGSDRIAANGDAANKIGTYGLAIAAQRHGVPFYVVAPYSTLDMTLASGDEIPIEERPDAEVTAFGACQAAPVGVRAFNPAFDVTPAELIAGIVTERGVFRPPYREAFEKDYR